MKTKGGKKILIIVAHPDDETIWMGGTILRNKKRWDTTIVCLCRKDDTDRAPKFRRVCKAYNARCFMSDLEDEELEDIETGEVKERIPRAIKRKSWDAIYTHGANGEYGHKRHVIVHNAVEEMLSDNELSAKEVLFFAYQLRGRFAYASERADKFINLNDVELLSKRDIIKNIYGFDEKSFEVICSRKKESFKIRQKKYEVCSSLCLPS